MWTIRTDQITEQLKSSDGKALLHFLKALLYAHCWKHGVPTHTLTFTDETTIGDGGVDGKNNHPIGPDSGFVPQKCIWQLKTGQLSAGEIEKEVGKPKVKPHLQDGYGYIMVAAGRHAVTKMDELRNDLLKLVKDHLDWKDGDPEPYTQILFAEDLALWSQEYPGVVMRLKHQEISHHLIHLDTWGQPLITDTPRFIGFESRNRPIQTVQEHSRITRPVSHPLLVVASPPGAGSSRLVYEALKADEGLKHSVICLEDPRELQHTINYLRNQVELEAVLVVERCSLSAARTLQNQLKGLQARLRCIALVHAGPEQHLPGRSVRVEPYTVDELDHLLRNTFPALRPQQRLIVAVETDGHVGLALQACQHTMTTPGEVLSHGELEALLEEQVTEDEITALSVLALVDSLHPDHLQDLCEHLKLDPVHIKNALDGLSRRSRFVKFTGHWTLWPPMLAQHLYPQAWQRWAKQPELFFRRFPGVLRDAFLQGTARCGSAAARLSVIQSSLPDFYRLTVQDLKEVHTTRWLGQLLEIHPEEMLPRIRKLLEEVDWKQWEEPTDSMFAELPRRELVSVLETATLYSDLYDDAEALLFNLAVNETDFFFKSDNATAKWKQLYSPHLWPSPRSLLERTGRLRKVMEGTLAEQRLGLSALNALVGATQNIMTVSPRTLGGQMPHGIWPQQPEGLMDGMVEGLQEAWKLVIETASHPDPDLQERAKKVLVSKWMQAVRAGLAEPVFEALKSLPFSREHQKYLVKSIQGYLVNHPKLEGNLRQTLMELLELHTPADLAERLEWFLVGHLTSRSHQPEEHEVQKKLLFEQVHATPEQLKEALPVLNGHNFEEARWMGRELAHRDADGKRLPLLVEDLQDRVGGYVVHYLKGLLFHHPHLRSTVSGHLDRLKATHPTSYALVMEQLKEEFSSFSDLMHLMATNQIGLDLLERIGPPVTASPSEVLVFVQQVLRKPSLIPLASALGAVKRVLSTAPGQMLLKDEATRTLVWRLVECPDCLEETLWSHALPTLQVLQELDLRRVVGLVLDHLILKNPGFQDLYVEFIQCSLVQRDPKLTLDLLWERMSMEKQPGSWSHRNQVTWVLVQLPPEEVVEWLKKQEEATVVAFMEHLPHPRWQDALTIPEVTSGVLTAFEYSKAVTQAFVQTANRMSAYETNENRNERLPLAFYRALDTSDLKTLREWGRSLRTLHAVLEE